jgi:SAM-dependent methyltransferase
MTNSPPPSDPVQRTLAYYNANAEAFITRTRDADLGAIYPEFLRHIPAGGRILDAGCGWGRDTLAFTSRGYSVTAFDGSEALAKEASAHTGQPIACMTFDDVAYPATFDGVWACASLLHLPPDQIASVLTKLTDALRVGGVLYASFKVGQGDGWREGRFFSDYDEAKMEGILKDHPRLRLLKMWRASDPRPEVVWLNLIARRGE